MGRNEASWFIEVNVNRLPQYRCHKVVRAAQVLEIEQDHQLGCFRLTLRDTEVQLMVTENWYRSKIVSFPADDLGYVVVYDDQYVSWSPTKAFEEGYSLMEEVAGG